MLKGYLLSTGLIIFWILAQITVYHIFQPKKKFWTMTLLFIGTLPFYAFFYFFTPSDVFFLPSSLSQTPVLLGFLNGFILHVLLYGTFVECFYYVDRPLTLRMLVEVLQAPGRTLTLSELQTRYSFREMIRSRLEVMVHNRYLSEQRQIYSLTTKGRIFANGFLLIRRILGIPYYLNTDAG